MTDNGALGELLREARRRWRLGRSLRGAAIASSILLATFLIAAWILDWFRFAPGVVLALRIAIVAVVGVAGAWFVGRPSVRRVSDTQVALYIEEHDPELRSALVGVVARDRSDDPLSAALAERSAERAVAAIVERGTVRRIDAESLKRSAQWVAGVVAAGLLLPMIGPPFLRHAASALFLLTTKVEAASPYRIDVAPGTASLPRGADQTITARLVGFESEDVTLLVRRDPAGAFDRLPLVRATDTDAYEGLIVDVPGPVDYFVESSGVRSPVFTLSVVDVPFVERLELVYEFPAHTRLAPQTIENGGDIAVIRGTVVRVRVHATMPTSGGALVLGDASEGGARIDLTPESATTLTGEFRVDASGFYRVELQGADGPKPASPQYTIDVLDDRAPSVTFRKPGRDTTVTPLEEAFVEVEAEDDFGVTQLDLVYTVNGGDEKKIRLFAGSRKPMPSVTAGHTFYLEELGVAPGDFVSYFARATDNDEFSKGQTTTSDLYFMQVRPFGKEFEAAQSMAGGGGGGGGAGQVGALSQQQREIVSATFNLVRDRKRFSADKFRESLVVVGLSQTRLREQVEGLVARMTSRLVEPDPSFKQIADLLPQAAEAMKDAEAKLQAGAPNEALPPEQRALQLLQKAEEEYRVQVTQNQSGGGGGGGQQSQIAQELADLFQLQLDKLANQYETARGADEQGNDQRLDELSEKLKELARRQEQEAERQRRQASAGQSSGGGGGGASQRALAEQVEEAARQLEKLSREEPRSELASAARQLRDAADAMRRAAAGGDPSAAAQASAALERLRDVQDKLARGQAGRAERDIKDAARKAAEAAREHQQLQDDTARAAQSGGLGKAEDVGRLAERKDALEGKLSDLEKQLDRTAMGIRRDERDAARRLQEAADGIRDDKLKEKVRYSKGLMRSASPDQRKAFDEDITKGLDALQRKVDEAARALGHKTEDRLGQARDKARDLARGIESLGERMREGGRDGRDGPNGRNEREASGQPGQKSQGQSQSQGQGQGSQKGESQSPGGGGGGGTRTGEAQRSDASPADGRGSGDTQGAFAGGGGFGNRRPGRFTDEDIRQFRGEVRQWSNEGRDLRRLLQQEGVSTKDLDELLGALRTLDADRVYHDAEELARLQTSVAEGFKRFEFTLRRQADSANEAALANADGAPQGYRELVEEYFRALARKKP
ncbi:MAG: DUF4175 family protein [Vicinamibacterales bacterium]